MRLKNRKRLQAFQLSVLLSAADNLWLINGKADASLRSA
jgi:hypothetical protein